MSMYAKKSGLFRWFLYAKKSRLYRQFLQYLQNAKKGGKFPPFIFLIVNHIKSNLVFWMQFTIICLFLFCLVCGFSLLAILIMLLFIFSTSFFRPLHLSRLGTGYGCITESPEGLFLFIEKFFYCGCSCFNIAYGWNISKEFHF